mmetsp:Transcript_32489/g.92083  ORF Transcript_32489/g.92083 Transcript_32489/m.92083 type:complete len:81 (+) Transcript_32489:503-745(+)
MLHPTLSMHLLFPMLCYSFPSQAVNILEDDGLRQGLKEYSAWPTFPQVYIEGEFFGGCDIMIEEYQNGNLKEVLEKVMME